MRLRLREWTREDREQLVRLANNREIAKQLRDLFPHPYTPVEADHWLRVKNKNPLAKNYAIEYHGELAGGCGLYRREDVYRLSAEIGYWIGEPFWNRGIATEAIRLLVEQCRRQFPDIIRIYAEVFSTNKASMRVLEKNGFREEAIRQKAVYKNGMILDDHVWVFFPAG